MSNAGSLDASSHQLFLRMHLTMGLGIRTAHRLIRRLGSAEAVFACTPKYLESLAVPEDVGRALVGTRSLDLAKAETERAQQLGAEIIAFADPRYPELLRHISDPPLVLYVRGTFPDLHVPQVAIVGTRRPSAYGLNCAERLAEDLARVDLCVTSGMARGIDGAAHRGALRTGRTIAVFGSGLDVPYPKQNRKLVELTESKGAIVSEFPIGTPPSPENFPIRNRIIAGLSLGVLVVEAAEHSGSLITARCAIDEGREVFAVPGPIQAAGSFGPHALIRQGAKLAADWQDVVEELPANVRERILRPLLDSAAAPDLAETLTGIPRDIWKLLSADRETSIDTLLERLSGSPPEIYEALLFLESGNLVRQLSGRRYVRRM